jgi:hypothetical protein
VDNDGNFLFVAIMERLCNITKRNWKQANPDGIGFTSWLASHPEAVIDIDAHNEAVGMRWAKRNSGNARLITSVVKAIASYGCVDFHDGNVMLRLPVGDVVLTDPVCTSLTNRVAATFEKSVLE